MNFWIVTTTEGSWEITKTRSVHAFNREVDRNKVNVGDKIVCHITVNVASESRRELYAFKLNMLEKVIRAHGRHASVDAIYYESLLLGIVKSREELADVLRLAEREERIVQGPCGTWRSARPPVRKVCEGIRATDGPN